MRLWEKIRTTGSAAFTLAAATADRVRGNRSRYDESASAARYLNTPRLIANQTGQAVWRHDQAEPFGNSPPDENPSGLGAFEFPLRDEGTYADKETNLVYNWNRYRDLDSGRFIQADPLGLDGGDLSLYVLRKNSPLLFTDPYGLQSELEGGRRPGFPWLNPSGEAQQRLARQLSRMFSGQEEEGCCPDCGEPPPRIDRVPPSRPHAPCPGDHWVYFEYHQSPYPDCKCRLVKRFGGCLPQGGYPPGWTGGQPPRNPPVRPDRDF